MSLPGLVALAGTGLVLFASFLFLPNAPDLPILGAGDWPKLILLALGCGWSLLGTVQLLRLGQGGFKKVMASLLCLGTLGIGGVMTFWVQDFSYRLPAPIETKQMESVRAFAGVDQAGKPVSDQSLQGKPYVLLFTRGFWCPFCVRELVVLQSVLDEPEFKGVEAVTVCGDTPEAAKDGAERTGLKFHVIGDSELKIINAWGLRHDEAVPGKTTARPAAFFVTADGKIAQAVQPDNYRKRMDAEAIRAGLRKAMGK